MGSGSAIDATACMWKSKDNTQSPYTLWSVCPRDWTQWSDLTTGALTQLFLSQLFTRPQSGPSLFAQGKPWQHPHKCLCTSAQESKATPLHCMPKDVSKNWFLNCVSLSVVCPSIFKWQPGPYFPHRLVLDTASISLPAFLPGHSIRSPLSRRAGEEVLYCPCSPWT